MIVTRVGGTRGTEAGTCAALCVIALFACKKAKSDAEPVATSVATLSTSAAIASPPAPAPAAELPSVPERRVPEGTLDGGAWLPAFRAVRPSGDAGKSWLEARTACTDASLELCSEPEWQRACAEDTAVGKLEAWTLRVEDSRGFVVRGGPDCSTRKIETGSAKSASRGALCCERAIAIDTTNKNKSFLRATSAKLLAFEKAVNQKSASAIAALLDDELQFFQMKDATREQARAKFEGSYRQYPSQWFAHGTCTATIEKNLPDTQDDDTWTAECDKVAYRGGEVGVTMSRYVFGGSNGKIRAITEPRIVRNWAPP